MKFCALASGSSGNCFYIGENEKNGGGILIDAGISCKQICERLNRIGKTPEQIKGIFITHEHSDHIKGADVFSRSFNTPVYATKKTIKESFIISNTKMLNDISNHEQIDVGNLQVKAFSKSHKAADPVSFSVHDKKTSKTVSVITDAGHACKNIIEAVSSSDLLCLESNHDLKMLEHGPYPYFLKQWIRSDMGHLSNMQAALCVLEHGQKNMKNLVLAHLSENNNTPNHALKTFSILKERHDLHPHVSVSLRDAPSELLKI